MKRYTPDHIYIEERALTFKATRIILENLAGVPQEIIQNFSEKQKEIKSSRDPIGEGKRTLLLSYDDGNSFKQFPETLPYLSCDYFTLHTEEGCDMECSYCILQAYLTNPVLRVFVNIEEMLERLQAILGKNPQRLFRVGTGQLADSLSFDHFTAFSETLVPFFAKQKNAALELKTKTDNIERLLGLEHGGKTIVSWSMNSKKIQTEEEHKCASIEERIQAAKITAQAGYQIGFHFDPIVDYPGWEKDYLEVIEQLFSQVPSSSIAWISLGCLRMMKELKPVIQHRFKKSSLLQSEWIAGMDGKWRYFKPNRIAMYKKMTEFIRSLAGNDVTLYLSMESPEVWKEVFGQTPTKESVCAMLDNAAVTAQNKAL
jgi:spore photoproduct lyase